MKKTILILVDGMRPDAVIQAGHRVVDELKAHSVYTLRAQTVMPSVTLPCHMSLFHSVTPQRHGILSNTYVPQVRPVRGLCEVLSAAGKKCAFFFNWEELRDLSRPGSLAYSKFISGRYGYEASNEALTDDAIAYVNAEKPDFAFLYLGFVDEAGHGHGWMGEEYMYSVKESLDCIERVMNSVPEDYTIIITADHGGHDRSHGTELPEDMTIPLFIYDPEWEGRELSEANIMDIAPTITALAGVSPDRDWEGRDLLA